MHARMYFATCVQGSGVMGLSPKPWRALKETPKGQDGKTATNPLLISKNSINDDDGAL